ncbi:hypothetical protein [Achromobacter anxifer]|uniref:hypothetical protein n=1 Tax=Achromobacter anxifer TaxID=1287737 RepID=UPI0023F7C942|nr:hypothetical protein [Achromobacter anxifer]MDF8362979.1 hypothetical protein [Achromobacter anxifer]
MNTNPFTEEIETLERNHDAARNELDRWKAKLTWFEGVNLDQATGELMRTQRTQAETQTRLVAMRLGLVDLATTVQRLEEEAGMGIDPRHWFSSERAIAKRQLAAMQQKLADGKASISSMEAAISNAAVAGRDIQSRIEKARVFDPLLAQSAIVALQTTIERLAPQLAALRHRSDKLDETLLEPQQRLYDEERERTQLLDRIELAEKFEDELSKAASYEKRQIHSRCGSRLGDERPGVIMRESRKALRRVEADITKLRARIAELVKIASRDVRNIVIDGNNLCYEGGSGFIGLAALEAIVPVLAEAYKVTLIFDSGIRGKLKLSNKDIEAAFPDAAQVHVVASKRKADELVLDVAGDDRYTFVLSNDRFADFPEKSAVKEARVLQHEIFCQMARIYDLRIEVPFDLQAEQEAAP